MPGETPPRVSTRWEGTHTYKKPEASKRKARTVAQLREEAAAKSKANREEAIRLRRGSIGSIEVEVSSTRSGLSDGGKGETRQTSRSTPLRRGSTGAIRPPVTTSTSTSSTPTGGTEDPVQVPSAESTATKASGQEEGDMPGSGKKKKHASGDGRPEGEAGGTSTGEGVDPALLRFLTTMKHDLMESTREAVGRIETRLERNEASIVNLEKRVERGEREITGKIASEVAKQVGAASNMPGPSADATTKTRLDKHEKAYHFCRRSLKLWPIEGDQLEDGVRNFLKTQLGLSDGRIRALGSIEATALPGRLAKEKKEILATFETREDRDSIKANGISLAGKRNVGMSIHVPGYLMDNLVALNGLGYSIKQKLPDTKRSVKFDDVARDLYLDICISGTWKRIGPAEARQVLKVVPTASTNSMSISVAELTSLVGSKSSKAGEETEPITIPDDDSNMEA